MTGRILLFCCCYLSCFAQVLLLQGMLQQQAQPRVKTEGAQAGG